MHAVRAPYFGRIARVREVGEACPQQTLVPRNKSDNPGRHAQYLPSFAKPRCYRTPPAKKGLDWFCRDSVLFSGDAFADAGTVRYGSRPGRV